MSHTATDPVQAHILSIPGLEGWASPFLALLLIIAAAGLFGGWAAYLIEPRPTEGQDKPKLTRFLVLGVIAAGCVPLFLSLVQSSLTRSILEGHDSPYDKLLIFIGLCMITGLSARRFLDSVTKRLLQQVEQQGRDIERTEQKADAAEQTAQSALSETEVLSEQVDAPDDAPEAALVESQDPGQGDNRQGSVDEEAEEAGPAAPVESAEDVPGEQAGDGASAEAPRTRYFASELQNAIGKNELAVLHALTLMSLRTVGGIVKDTGLSRREVGDILQNLRQRRLVELTASAKTSSPRWKITFLGRTVLIRS